MTHPSLSLAEKRAILESWASDASAIASCPALRAPEGLKAPVSIDAILEALCELDGGPRNPPGGKPKRRFSTTRARRHALSDTCLGGGPGNTGQGIILWLF